MTQNEHNETWEAGFRAGFYAGFRSTGEGYNAEYPFGDKDIDIETDEDIKRHIEQALKGETP